MRNRLSRCLLLPCLLTPLFCSAQESYQAKLAPESLLLDIVDQGGVAYAVGERGHMLTSEDGETWTQQSVPSLATITAIDFSGEKGWAVGHDATILHLASKDGQWQTQMFAPELEKPLLDVLFFDPNHGIAIGAYGTFFRTLDGGENWESELHPEFLHPDDQEYLEEIRLEDEEFYQEELASILPHLNRVSMSGDRLYLAGESGLLAFSDDQGKKWQRMDINYEGSFFDIGQTQSGKLLAAGLRGNLFEYDQANQRWQRLNSGSQASLNSIVTINDAKALVVGNNGNTLCVDDNGIQVSQTDDSEAISNAILFAGKIVAVTAAGLQTLALDPTTNTCNKEPQ